MFFLPGWFQLLQNIVYTRCSTQQPAEPEVIVFLETILLIKQTNLPTQPNTHPLNIQSMNNSTNQPMNQRPTQPTS